MFVFQAAAVYNVRSWQDDEEVSCLCCTINNLPLTIKPTQYKFQELTNSKPQHLC